MNLFQKLACTSACCMTLLTGQLMAAESKAVELESGEAKACCAKDGATCCADKEACAGEECAVKMAMDKLPTMTFLVGEEETCCSESAAQLAEAGDHAIQFKVGDEMFDSEGEAFTALVSQTEAMVTEFTTPHTCSVSGNTSIAGTTCSCEMKAGAIAEKVEAATKLVSMSFLVGEETCNCPHAAKAMASKEGLETTFVVNGEKTQCETTARLNLARAKYKAAVMAAMPEPEAAPESAPEAGTDS